MFPAKGPLVRRLAHTFARLSSALLLLAGGFLACATASLLLVCTPARRPTAESKVRRAGRRVDRLLQLQGRMGDEARTERRSIEDARGMCDQRRLEELEMIGRELRAALSRLELEQEGLWREQLHEIREAVSAHRSASDTHRTPLLEGTTSPQSTHLPPGTVADISRPYQRKRHDLVRRRTDLERHAAEARRQVEARYERERERLAAQERATFARRSVRDDRLRTELAEARLALRRERAALSAHRRRLDSVHAPTRPYPDEERQGSE